MQYFEVCIQRIIYYPLRPWERIHKWRGSNTSYIVGLMKMATWCQSSVVCVMCSRLLCPYLVCFLSSSDVIMSLFLSSRVCLIVYDYPLYISPVFWVWFRLVYSLLSRCILSVSLALSCHVLPWCLIKYDYLSLYPRLRVPVPPSCVHRDRRPDLTVSGAHSPRFVFLFFKSLLFCAYVLSVSRQGSCRSSSRSSPRKMRGSSAGPPRVPRVLWSRALFGPPAGLSQARRRVA